MNKASFVTVSSLVLAITVGCGDRRAENMQAEIQAELQDKVAEVQLHKSEADALQNLVAKLKEKQAEAEASAKAALTASEAAIAESTRTKAEFAEQQKQVSLELEACQKQLAESQGQLEASKAEAATALASETAQKREAESQLAALKQAIADSQTTASTATDELIEARHQKYLALKALAESERSRADLQKQLTNWATQLAATQSVKLDEANRDAAVAEDLMETAKDGAKVSPETEAATDTHRLEMPTFVDKAGEAEPPANEAMEGEFEVEIDVPSKDVPAKKSAESETEREDELTIDKPTTESDS